MRLSSPVSVFLNLTNSCNLRCVYCSAASGVPDPMDLAPDELRRVIDELIALKVLKVIVTGGEPFVRTDVFDLLERLLGGGLCLSLITNGTLIRGETAQRLAELGLWNVSVSLDGTLPEVNDRTRGEGSLGRALEGIGQLMDHGVTPFILVTVTASNVAHVADLVDHLTDLGVKGAAFNLMASQGRGDGCGSLRVPPDRIRQLAADLERVKSERDGFVREDLLHWLELPPRLELRSTLDPSRCRDSRLLPCDAAKTACAIGSDGTVYPCNRFGDYPCGNLRSQSLQEIWLGERMQRIRDLAAVPTSRSRGCASCRYSPVCSGGCRALAHLAYADLEAPDPSCALLSDAGCHSYAEGAELVRVVASGHP